MFSFIKGEVTDTTDNTVILENNGIGYEIMVSSASLGKIRRGSSFVSLYTYLAVREDGLFLYGFYSKEEKNMFLKLTTVTGVGPKAAMGILSGIELERLMTAILASDVKTLSSVKGIGKKTAERIILELREKLNEESLFLLETFKEDGNTEIDKDSADAISALRGLGFSQNEAVAAVNRVKSKAKSAEELVSLALRSGF